MNSDMSHVTILLKSAVSLIFQVLKSRIVMHLRSVGKSLYHICAKFSWESNSDSILKIC